MTFLTILDGTAGNDTLNGTFGADMLTGGDGNDRLNGGDGDDILDAGAGTNQIDAGAGNDIILIDGTSTNGLLTVPANGIVGGAGFDTVVFDGPVANFHITQVAGGNLTVVNLTNGQRDVMTGIEALRFADTTLALSGLAPEIIVGSFAGDTLTGGNGAEAFYGLGGNDRLNGAGGNDTLNAGAGTNQIDAGAGDDLIVIDGTAVNGAMGVPANGIVADDGYDTVSYSGAVANYRITQTAGGPLTVVNLTNGSRDMMTGVERLEFADTAVVLVQPNNAPVVSGTITATLAEDSAAQVFDALAFASDADPTDTLSVANLVALPDGVTFDAVTQSFTVDPSAAAIQALTAQQTMILTVSYDVTDGISFTPATAIFTINGSNDTPIVEGNTGASLIEDALTTVSGQLLITDVDSGEAGFVATTLPIQGLYGSLTLDANGGWVYVLDNASAAVQALTSAQTVADIITVTTLDGTQIPLDFSITGQDDLLVITGTAGNDRLTGTAGADDLRGLSGADTVVGAGGNDLLNGGAGADSLLGGAGDDRVIHDAADRFADGGAGLLDVLVVGGGVKVNLGAADQVSGDKGTTVGFEGVDASAALTSVTLRGGSGMNLLSGGIGNDLLQGGRGADAMWGGGGADRFVFTAVADSAAAMGDQIGDFTSGVDKLDLTTIDAIAGGANNAFAFIGGAAFSAAGQLRYDLANGLLEADVTGDGVADFALEFGAEVLVLASDILL